MTRSGHVGVSFRVAVVTGAATRAELDAVAAAHPDAVRPVVADVRDQAALAAADGGFIG